MSAKNVVFLIPDYFKFQLDRRIRDQAKLFGDQGYEVFLIMLGDQSQVSKQESYFIITVDKKVSNECLNQVMSVVSQDESQLLENEITGAFAKEGVWTYFPFGRYLKRIYSHLPLKVKLHIRLFIYADIWESIILIDKLDDFIETLIKNIWNFIIKPLWKEKKFQSPNIISNNNDFRSELIFDNIAREQSKFITEQGNKILNCFIQH
jgi:hypothetical protein